MAKKAIPEKGYSKRPVDAIPVRHGNWKPVTLSARTESGLPSLPVINWKEAGGKMPVLIPLNGYKNAGPLPKADIVIITWTVAEWAAFDHVFCESQAQMSYYEKNTWQKKWVPYSNNYAQYLKPSIPNSYFTKKSPSTSAKAWGDFCMVKLGNGKKAILFKSNIHISTDGPGIPLINMMDNILTDSGASLVLTIGTAGGSRPKDCLGSVNITNGGHFLLSAPLKNKPFNNKTFNSSWKPKTGLLSKVKSLFMTTPVTTEHLEEMAKKMKGGYSLKQLINKEIEPGKIKPVCNVLRIPVLTTNGFVIGTTDGKYKKYAAMEMDDAVIGMECNKRKVNFAVVRNISDPVQNTKLPYKVQSSWGSTVYQAYGLYSSFNGALCAWAIASA